MKFRFCGDLDCPDWVLAEIMTLSKITSVKMKLMTNQVLNGLLGGDIDFDKIQKLTSDAKYDISDIKATVAALVFILNSAAKHNVDSESLLNELQQLGLPKEHTVSLCKSYHDKLEALRLHLADKSLRLSVLGDIHWRVDYVIGSSQLKEVNEPCVQLNLKSSQQNCETVNETSFTVTADNTRLLLSELRKVYKLMENLG